MFRLLEIQKKGRWTTIIPRDKIPDSSDTVVSKRHRPKDYPKIIDYEKLCARNPPSMFDCIKLSLLTTAHSAQKKTLELKMKLEI